MKTKSVLIIDNGSVYLPQLKRLFSDNNLTVIHPDGIDIAIAEKFDLVVLSGGFLHEVMDSDEYYKSELQLIRRGKVPIFGVCLGLQLIAHAFDMPVHKMPRAAGGQVLIRTTDYGAKIIGYGPFHVFEDHRWVVSKVPEDFHAIARSHFGIEAFKHETLPIIGVQFHPEMFVSKSNGRTIFRSLLQVLLPAEQN